MFKLLIDTCVWLDVARDPRQHPVIGVVEEMIKEKRIALVVPTIVLDEFRRNRDRIAKESARSLRAHFQVVKEAVNKVGGAKRRLKTVLSHLDDVGHKIPILGGSAEGALDRIEKLLTTARAIEPSDLVKMRAAERAIARRAPFHHDKNSMADALIIELYHECVRGEHPAGTRFAFITHNKNDFSTEGGNQRLPHVDLATLFSRVKSLYFINLTEALRRIDPSFVTEVMLDYSFDQEPRGLNELLEAEHLHFHQVWYNRHWNLRHAIESGQHRLVSREEWERGKDSQHTTIEEVWDGALRSAEAVEKRYGKENLGPWTDFEWGMVNGKLSALRWVLGYDWDVLDT